MRVLLTPRWLGLHLLLAVGTAGLVRLGVWQLHRAEAGTGTFASYGYAVEWWVFAVLGIGFYVRYLLTEVVPREPGAERHPKPPQGPVLPVAPQIDLEYADTPEDRELAAYNAYLAELEADHRRRATR